MPDSPAAAKPKSTNTRGPSYPSFDLGEAIAKAGVMLDKDGRNAIPIESAVAHWGYGPKSSGGRQVVATLIQYGLLEDSGSGTQRRVKLTRSALDILAMDSSNPERAQKIREAFLNPKLFGEIVSKFPDGKVSDNTLYHFLLAEKGVNKSVLNDVINDFRSSSALALTAAEEEEPPPPPPPKIEEGDFVQWENNGVLAFRDPRKVRAITEDEDHNYWAFVEGSETGIPIEELIFESKGAAVAYKPPPRLPLAQEINTVTRIGEREWLNSAFGREVSMRITISGAEIPSVKQIDKLITLLQAQKTILADDDE